MKIPKSKFNVGDKVLIYANEGEGVGVIKGKEFQFHPEYWGSGTKPRWAYTVKNHPKAPKYLEDIQGIWQEHKIAKKIKSLKEIE
jgi:hypothetical protein